MRENAPATPNSRTTNVKRSRRTIRFFEPDWERVEAFANNRGLPAAEFVRYATLAMIADGGNSVARVAPIIESTFRGTYILATRMRNQMFEAGEREHLDTLIADAREVQDKLLERASDRWRTQ